MLENITIFADLGYLGIENLHSKSFIPRKSSKNKKLSKEDVKYNRNIARERVLNENIIGKLKRFKIISDRYRNRRNRFKLRFNLISSIYNFEFSL